MNNNNNNNNNNKTKIEDNLKKISTDLDKISIVCGGCIHFTTRFQQFSRYINDCKS